jgi:hypothetical protein
MDRKQALFLAGVVLVEAATGNPGSPRELPDRDGVIAPLCDQLDRRRVNASQLVVGDLLSGSTRARLQLPGLPSHTSPLQPQLRQIPFSLSLRPLQYLETL